MIGYIVPLGVALRIAAIIFFFAGFISMMYASAKKMENDYDSAYKNQERATICFLAETLFLLFILLIGV